MKNAFVAYVELDAEGREPLIVQFDMLFLNSEWLKHWCLFTLFSPLFCDYSSIRSKCQEIFF